jgi:hypothetical protein
MSMDLLVTDGAAALLRERGGVAAIDLISPVG